MERRHRRRKSNDQCSRSVCRWRPCPRPRSRRAGRARQPKGRRRYSQLSLGQSEEGSDLELSIETGVAIVIAVIHYPFLHHSMNAALRAAVIAEWRGLPGRKMQADRWQSAAVLMPKLMQRLGL